MSDKEIQANVEEIQANVGAESANPYVYNWTLINNVWLVTVVSFAV